MSSVSWSEQLPVHPSPEQIRQPDSGQVDGLTERKGRDCRVDYTCEFCPFP